MAGHSTTRQVRTTAQERPRTPLSLYPPHLYLSLHFSLYLSLLLPPLFLPPAISSYLLFDRLPVPMTPIIAFERLFFAVFGQTSPDDINSQRSSRPEWTENLFKIVFGIYMLVSVVVLINLLIAMMSDTYQRIQVSLYVC